MSKRRILLFSIMTALVALLFSVTVFAVNEDVYFKVVTDKGTIKEEHATVGELFNVTNTGGDRIISGIASEVNGYKLDRIIEVSVPNGIRKVNIVDPFPSIKTIVFGDLCIADIKITGLTGLETIKVEGTGHNLTFNDTCVNTAAPLKEIIIDSKNATIIFNDNCFKNVTALKSITFSAGANDDSCTYTMKANSFKNTGLESLKLIDNAKFVFTDVSGTSFYDSIFANCAQLTDVYVGNTIKTIDKNMFANCPKLETVYVSAATDIKGSAFKITEGSEENVLGFFVHSQKNVNLDTNTFAGRKTKGVVVCVLSTGIDKLNDCKFELHVGIQHTYYEVKDGSCYTYYGTECPCGRVSNAYYRLYIGSGGKIEQTKEVKIVPFANAGGEHSYTQANRIEYADGIHKAGVVVLRCAVCGAVDDVERVSAPIVTFLGYSVSEFGDSRSVIAGVEFDYLAMKHYESVMGNTFEFGMVMASKQVIGENSPLKADGSAYSDKVLVLDMSGNGDYETSIRINGLSEEMLDAEFVISAYVLVGKEIKYFQGDGALKTPQSISYSQLAE